MRSGGRGPQGRIGSGGFSLVELMVTVAVLAILSAVAVPSMTGLINANRLSSASSELVAAVQFARSEAVRRNVRVKLCGTADGATCSKAAAWSGWLVVDESGAKPEVLRALVAPESLQISGPANGVVFRPSGLLSAASSLTVCMPTTNPSSNQRVITINVSGSARSSSKDGKGQCA